MSDYIAEGHDITDEIVACTTAETIGLTTYYVGHAAEGASHAVVGNVHPSYGAWTAASMGGTRREVIVEGLPVTGQVSWDIESGKIISPISQTIYVRYRGFGSHVYASALASHSLHCHGHLTNGVTRDWARLVVDKDGTFSRAAIVVDGNLSSNAVTVELFTGAGRAGSTATFTLTGGASASGITALSAPISVSAGGTLYLNFNGKGISTVTVYLFK